MLLKCLQKLQCNREYKLKKRSNLNIALYGLLGGGILLSCASSDDSLKVLPDGFTGKVDATCTQSSQEVRQQGATRKVPIEGKKLTQNFQAEFKAGQVVTWRAMGLYDDFHAATEYCQFGNEGDCQPKSLASGHQLFSIRNFPLLRNTPLRASEYSAVLTSDGTTLMIDKNYMTNSVGWQQDFYKCSFERR